MKETETLKEKKNARDVNRFTSCGDNANILQKISDKIIDNMKKNGIFVEQANIDSGLIQIYNELLGDTRLNSNDISMVLKKVSQEVNGVSYDVSVIKNAVNERKDSIIKTNDERKIDTPEKEGTVNRNLQNPNEFKPIQLNKVFNEQQYRSEFKRSNLLDEAIEEIVADFKKQKEAYAELEKKHEEDIKAIEEEIGDDEELQKDVKSKIELVAAAVKDYKEESNNQNKLNVLEKVGVLLTSKSESVKKIVINLIKECGLDDVLDKDENGESIINIEKIAKVAGNLRVDVYNVEYKSQEEKEFFINDAMQDYLYEFAGNFNKSVQKPSPENDGADKILADSNKDKKNDHGLNSVSEEIEDVDESIDVLNSIEYSNKDEENDYGSNSVSEEIADKRNNVLDTIANGNKKITFSANNPNSVSEDIVTKIVLKSAERFCDSEKKHKLLNIAVIVNQLNALNCVEAQNLILQIGQKYELDILDSDENGRPCISEKKIKRLYEGARRESQNRGKETAYISDFNKFNRLFAKGAISDGKFNLGDFKNESEKVSANSIECYDR